MSKKFLVGDLVKHKASGECGVVVKVMESCQAEDHLEAMSRNPQLRCTALNLQTPHDIQPNGEYMLSFGFDKKTCVSECEICLF